MGPIKNPLCKITADMMEIWLTLCERGYLSLVLGRSGADQSCLKINVSLVLAIYCCHDLNG